MDKPHKNRWMTIVALIICAVVAVAIFFSRKSIIPNNEQVSSNTVTEPQIPVVPKVDVQYHNITLETSKPLAELTKLVGEANVPVVLSLNRIDAAYLKSKETLVVPNSFDDLFSLSSFPKVVPELASVPKIILVSQKVQEFAVYQNGNLIRFGAVSTGKQSTQTPSRLYYTNWKGKLVVSTVDDSWIMPWYFNLDNLGGVSMHQYDLPGYPASHSCVRLSEADAKWLYDWSDQWILSKDGQKVLTNGTPLLVFGTYDFKSPAPWKNLPEDKNATTISVDDISKALAPEASTLNISAQPLLPHQ